MVVWQGVAFLALFFPLLVFIGADSLARFALADSYSPVVRMAVIVSVTFLSAVFIYWLGVKLNKNAKRILIDPENNQPVEINNSHTLFWIPMQYWSLLWVFFACWMLWQGIEWFE